jgi:hypothetical protein
MLESEKEALTLIKLRHTIPCVSPENEAEIAANIILTLAEKIKCERGTRFKELTSLDRAIQEINIRGKDDLY